MPQNFGYKHLTGLCWLFLLIIILLSILLFVRKKFNKGEQFDTKVIRYTCFFMWGLEIVKTIRMVNYSDYGPIGHYPLWMAPFHICSMGLYAYLILGSKKESKLKEWIKPFGCSLMLLVTLIILIIPGSSGILGFKDHWRFEFDNILPFQSFIYHGCLVFVPFYMILSGYYKPKFSDIYKSTIVLIVCACIAQSLNYIFEGSSCDFMMLRYGNGNPFQFLLTSSPLIYYLLMAIVAIGGNALVITIIIVFKKIINNKMPK